MNDAQRTRLLTQAAQHCTNIAHHLGTLRIAIGLRQLGYPPEHWLHGATGSPSGSDVTATAALGHDTAAVDLAALDRHINNITQTTHALRHLSDKYLAVINPQPDEVIWCRSCQRDNNYCEPVAADYRAKRLCRWCATFERNHHRLPPISLLAKRHRGRRIYEADIARALAGRR